MTTARVEPVLLRARTAVYSTFAMSGLAFSSFASRTPAIREVLGLSTAQLGLLLLCVSTGSVAGLPLSGPFVQRFGTARAVLGGALGVGVGLALASVGFLVSSVVPAAAGFVLVGLGIGVWDVAMNVEGADVERRLDRSLMPRLHAAFSLGTVVGAGIGTLTAAAGVPVAAQTLGIAIFCPLLMAWSTRRFLAREASVEPDRPERSSALRAWLEPRTLLVGLLVLAFAFTEGSANDWIAVALVDGHRASETVGALAFGLFVMAMTVGRLVGGRALERFGRVPVLRATAGCALVGLLLVLVGGATPLALVGALLWGLGAALGFPVGISAAADHPARAAARVSVVTTIGYTAFLAGPPLIGLLAQLDGILRALFVVVGALVLGLVASGATRALTPPYR